MKSKDFVKLAKDNFINFFYNSMIYSIVKLGNRCALKLEKATKASFTGFFSCYLFLKVPHGQVCIKTQAYGIKILSWC